MTAQITQLVQELLTDDLRAYPERTSALDEPGWNAFGEIVGAAFYAAVRRRFPGPEASDDITAFVDKAADEYAGTPVAIDTQAAQALVRSVLGDDGAVGEVLQQLDEPDLARIELVLLRGLLADEPSDAAAVDTVVSTAQEDAAEFSGEAGH